MTTLDTVKRALKHGKQKEAVYTLRRVLQYAPSAEAHYIAARLTRKQRLQVKHLHKALELDPTYEPAASMLSIIERDWSREIQALRQELAAPQPRPKLIARLLNFKL